MSNKSMSAVTLGDALDVTIQDIGIPPRPAILDRISQEMRQAEPDFHQLAKVISSDVGLAAGLLKIANSAYFGFGTRARTVSQALLILGLDVTSRALAGLILRRVFQTVRGLESFWSFSARVARTSGWLALQLKDRVSMAADEAYTFGLFRDCGIAILMRKQPGYREVLQAADGDLERLYTDIEDAACPTNHALVGCLLARDWWLADEMATAIRHHHDALALDRGEAVLPGGSSRLVAVAQLAEHFVQGATGQFANREWEKLGEVCQRQLGIDETTLAQLSDNLPADVIADDI